MSEPLFDDRARAQRRERALRRTAVPFLAERIVDDLVERLRPVQRQFGQALVTGAPPALEARLRHVAEQVSFAPLLEVLGEHDEESLDLLLVVGELDVRDELPLLLRIVRSRLAPHGLFAGTFPGGHNLSALRAALHATDQASGRFAARAHPRIEASAFAGLLGAAGFAEPVVDVERVRLRYRSFQRLVEDLRDHAGTNILAARPRHGLSKTAAAAARDAFENAAADGATEERVELLSFLAWAGANNRR